jgi:hypothetical protein
MNVWGSVDTVKTDEVRLLIPGYVDVIDIIY